MLVVQRPTEAAEYTPVSGAEVLFRPIDRAMLRRARRAAVEATGGGAAESDADPAEQLAELGDALSYAILVEGIADWRGVVIEVSEGDEVSSETLVCTAENVAIVLSDPLTFEAFDQAYVVPFIMRERERAAPGNGSAASPNGTGEAAMPASGTVSSAVTPSGPVAAGAAPTSSTKRSRKPKKTSGPS